METNMELAKIILDYVKTLIWPIILIFVVIVYEDDVMNLLNSREIDAFGLKIGQRIEDISKSYENEIAELKANIESSSDNEELLSKIQDIDTNIKKELAQVQRETTVAAPVDKVVLSKKQQAERHELNGFQAILDADIDLAIDQFTSARALWPEYHNVSEIQRLLTRSQANLITPAAWQELKQTILTRYSWGMPDSIRNQFKESVRE